MSDTKKVTPRNLGRGPFHRSTSNIRSIKMFGVECKDNPATGFKGCQDVPGAHATLWWKDCKKKGHDPHYRTVTRTEVRPKLEEVSPGRFKKVGEEVFEWYETEPVTFQVQVGERNGTLYGIDNLTWHRANGAILPSEHPTAPLADFCEYHQCWNQTGVKKYENGQYCSEEAAKRVAMDERGKTIEAHNSEKMRDQLDAVRV